MTYKKPRIIEVLDRGSIKMIIRENLNNGFTEFCTEENGKIYLQSSYHFGKDQCNKEYNLDFISFLGTSEKEKIKNVLICGHGVGSFARYLDIKLDEDVKITSIDLNETMIELSEKYFKFSDRVKVIQGDALEFLKNTDEKFDAIFYDIYNVQGEESFIVGFQNDELIEETSKNIKKCLNEDGILIMNLFQLDYGIIQKNIDSGKEPLKNVENINQIKNLFKINKKMKELFGREVNMISKQKYNVDTTTSAMYGKKEKLNLDQIVESNKKFFGNKKFDYRIVSKLNKYLVDEKEVMNLIEKELFS